MLPNINELMFQQLAKEISALSDRIGKIAIQRERAEVAGGVVSIVVASLPTANNTAGDLFFANNGLKVGESTGHGTGTLVYWNSATSTWKRVRDDADVST